MRAALRDKRRATAIEREVEITLLRAAAMDVWNAVPTGVVLPPEYVQAINRLGCAIRGEWHLLAPIAPDPAERRVDHSRLDPRTNCYASMRPGGVARMHIRAPLGGGDGAVYEWLPNRRVAPSAPEPPEGDSRVAPPPEIAPPAPVASPVAAVEPIPDAPETTKEVNP